MATNEAKDGIFQQLCTVYRVLQTSARQHTALATGCCNHKDCLCRIQKLSTLQEICTMSDELLSTSLKQKTCTTICASRSSAVTHATERYVWRMSWHQHRLNELRGRQHHDAGDAGVCCCDKHSWNTADDLTWDSNVDLRTSTVIPRTYTPTLQYTQSRKYLISILLVLPHLRFDASINTTTAPCPEKMEPWQTQLYSCNFCMECRWAKVKLTQQMSSAPKQCHYFTLWIKRPSCTKMHNIITDNCKKIRPEYQPASVQCNWSTKASKAAILLLQKPNVRIKSSAWNDHWLPWHKLKDDDVTDAQLQQWRHDPAWPTRFCDACFVLLQYSPHAVINWIYVWRISAGGYSSGKMNSGVFFRELHDIAWELHGMV